MSISGSGGAGGLSSSITVCVFLCGHMHQTNSPVQRNQPTNPRNSNQRPLHPPPPHQITNPTYEQDMASSVVSAVTAKIAAAAAGAAGTSSAASLTGAGGVGGSYVGPGSGGGGGNGGSGGGGGYGVMQGMGNPAFADPRRRGGGERGLLEKAGEVRSRLCAVRCCVLWGSGVCLGIVVDSTSVVRGAPTHPKQYQHHHHQMIGTVVQSVNSAAGVGVVVGGGGGGGATGPQRVTFAAPPDRGGGFASAHPGGFSVSFWGGGGCGCGWR